MNISDFKSYEQGIVGSLMFDENRAWEKLSAFDLNGKDFDDPICSKIFSAACTLRTAGNPVDTFTIQAATALSCEQIDELTKSSTTVEHVPFYAKEIQKRNCLRRIQTEAQAGDMDSVEKEVAVFTAQNKSIEKFSRVRLSDLQKYVADDKQKLAGDGWLRRGAGTVITGGTGIGKSVAVEQIAVCAVTGLSFFGIRFPSPLSVLYFSGENDVVTLQRDFLSIVKHVSGKPCPVLVEAGLDLRHIYGLNGQKFFDWVSGLIQRSFIKPDIIVCDTLQSFLPAQDVNSSETYLNFIHGFDAILKQYQAAGILVCHTPKPRDRDNWTVRDSVYMATGSSVLPNWARTSAELTAAGEDGRYRLRFGKNAERTGLVDEHGRLVRDLFIEHSGSISEPYWKLSENQNTPATSKFEAKIAEARRKNPEASVRDLAKIVGCSKSTVDKYDSQKDTDAF